VQNLRGADLRLPAKGREAVTPTERDLLFTRLNATLLVRVIVAVGSLIGRLLPAQNASSLFFFFPFYHVGGAERVHAAIVGCFSAERPRVFFTKKSANDGFLSLFGGQARLCDNWRLLKYGYPLSVGVMAGWINRHAQPVVFGSNSLFFYLLLPYLKKEARCIDLMHAFGGGSEHFSLAVAGRLNARVAISEKTVADLKEQYLEHRLPESLGSRVTLIENCVRVPERYTPKKRRPQLKALYVGRGSEEKRVHLVGRIAARCHREGIPLEVVVAGDASGAVDEADRGYCNFLGEVTDQGELQRAYDDADLLLLTSSREGFPMVIMEGMAHGVVPVSTDVGGIAVHVLNGENGWLVPQGLGEDAIVEQMCRILRGMSRERELLREMSRAAYDYARSGFSGEKFCSAYRSLLLGS